MIESETEIAMVRHILRGWLLAFNAKDIDTLFSYYDANSIYANATAPLLRGIDEVRAWYSGTIPNVTGTLRHKEEAAWHSGNLAAILGAYYFEPDTGVGTVTGRVFLLFLRQADGSWKLAFDMDNTPIDVLPQMFAD